MVSSTFKQDDMASDYKFHYLQEKHAQEPYQIDERYLYLIG